MKKPAEKEFYKRLRAIARANDPVTDKTAGVSQPGRASILALADTMAVPHKVVFGWLLKWSGAGWWDWGMWAWGGWFQPGAPETIDHL